MTNELSEKEGFILMGAAFEVHATIGGGMAEEIYQESLEIELGLRSIPFTTKAPLGMSYKGRTLRKEYFPDLLVKADIVAELKSVAKLLPLAGHIKVHHLWSHQSAPLRMRFF